MIPAVSETGDRVYTHIQVRRTTVENLRRFQAAVGAPDYDSALARALAGPVTSEPLRPGRKTSELWVRQARAIGSRIRRLRLAKHIPQGELAKSLGVNQPTLCNIEHGRVPERGVGREAAERALQLLGA